MVFPLLVCPAGPAATSPAVEATAAFLAVFKVLPGKTKGCSVELLDDYEDELNWRHYEADKAANPNDYDPNNSIIIQEYVEQREHRAGKTNQYTDSQPLAA